MDIRIKYFTEDIEKLRFIGDEKSDWIDLRASEDISLKAGESAYVPLGVAMEIPPNFEAHIVPRSSSFKNYGFIQTNSVGIIDNSYKGDNDMWMLPIYAVRDVEIKKNDRVCQFRIVPTMRLDVGFINFDEVKSLGNEDRSGFGSSGKQ